MKFTQYFLATQLRDDIKNIKQEWIEFVFNNFVKQEIQADGRIKRWAFIEDVNKYLRIIILDDNETIHNAFFDRNFKN